VSGNGQIIWEDPPGARRPSEHGRWVRALAPLIEHPGQWAKVATYVGKTAHVHVTRLRHGRAVAPPGRWEFTSRIIGDGSAIYARYLGPDEGAS
jgi:hypothetical protein